MPNTDKQLGLYSGTQKMASQNKLQALKTEIYNTFTGPEDSPKYHELSQIGYIPWKVKNDGSLDIEGLFPEIAEKINQCLGITIKNNNDLVLSGVHEINFTGNYVYFKVSEDNKLTIDIRKPLTEISRFNTTDGITDGTVIFKNQIVENCIIPNPDGIYNIYGDWTAGSKHNVLNYKEEDPLAILTTKQKILGLEDTSYFKIYVYDQTDERISAQFISNPIPSFDVNTYKVIGNENYLFNSPYIELYINNFEELETGYSFIPTFKINLYQIFQKSSNRFKIQIAQIDGNKEYKFISEAMLLNVTSYPVIQNYSLLIRTNTLRGDSPSSEYCSGLKYHTFGTLRLTIDNISGLNRFASVQNFEQINLDNVKDGASAEISGYSNTALNSQCHINYDFEYKDGTFINDKISGNIIARNAFGQTNKSALNCGALINLTNLNRSDDLSEYFDNQTNRQTTFFEGSWDSSASLVNNNGLMVIPSVGLKYPYGDWSSNFIPSSQPNYSSLVTSGAWRFYSRFFGSGILKTSKIKFGGIFKFSNLTKQQFLSNNILCIISNDNLNWFSLKHTRGLSTTINIPNQNRSISAIGVMTSITEKDGCIFVHWSYPPTSSSIGSSAGLYFQIGILPSLTSDILIKEISLLNLNEQKEW